jgi:dTDP-4-dehydrorhamnose reductase
VGADGGGRSHFVDPIWQTRFGDEDLGKIRYNAPVLKEGAFMHIFVTGADGNIGKRLAAELRTNGHIVTGTTIHDLDITDRDAVLRAVGRAAPQLVIHSAALTNVDYCAQHPDEANLINGQGTRHVAEAARSVGAVMCYVSTNEVFDGEANRFYGEDDTPNPINPYGESKLRGEVALREVMSDFMIVRTAWVFAHGGVNFLQKIVATAQAGKPLSVVTDEVASPTYAEDFITALMGLIPKVMNTRNYGVFHLTNEGATSRHEFARHILACHGMGDVPIAAITRADFQRPSRPPAYSPLKNERAAALGVTLRPWRDAVAAFVQRETERV